MKNTLGILMTLFLVVAVSVPLTALAEDLSADQVKALEGAGVPVYPGAYYLTGDNEDATVIWFGSKDPVDKIMDWYKDKLSGWSEITVNSSRVIYKGPGGAEAKDISTWPYVFARATDEDPGSTASEITVRIPR